MYRYIPWFFNWGYRNFEVHPAAFGEKAFWRKFLAISCKKLEAFIREGSYDAVICTHVFASMMLTDVKRRYGISVASGLVYTDYTCYPGSAQSDVDVHFISSEKIRDFCVKQGVPEDRIIVSGIPIRKDFRKKLAKEDAKKRFGIDPNHRHLIMMCGSMGCGPMEELTENLVKLLPQNVELTVVCGTNRVLRHKLQKYGHLHNIHIRGYVKHMSALMDSADLYLTKPGGISVTEAAVKDVPMVLISAVSGCEEYNRRFFLKAKGAVSGKTSEELAMRCAAILQEDDKLERMKMALSNQNIPDSAAVIRDYFANHIEK